jgi:hypothetical protein
MSQPTVQWTGDNTVEIENLLSKHVARADKEGDLCHIRGLDGLDLTLSPGDHLTVEGDRLGVFRQGTPAPELTVTWTGTNMAEVAQFIAGFHVTRVEVVGDTLMLYADGDPRPTVANRGDRLISRGGWLVVSKAGKDHRA